MEIPIRLVLVKPPAGVAFAIQKGRGAKRETIAVQLGGERNLAFDFSLTLTSTASGRLNFTGPFAQGAAADRFVYINVGTFAGQENSEWSRRIKVRLQGISKALVRNVLSKPGCTLIARVPGTGRDGTPSCATVALLDEWKTGKF